MYAFLLAAGDYKCFSVAKLLLRHQVFSSTVVGLNHFLVCWWLCSRYREKRLRNYGRWPDTSGWLYWLCPAHLYVVALHGGVKT